MDVYFSASVLSEFRELGLRRATALAQVLRNLRNYKVHRRLDFRCRFEGRGQVDCQLRVSEIVPGVESQLLYATLDDRLLVLGITEPERSATYDLEAITETVQALSATNWFEKGLRFNLSALRDETLAKVLSPLVPHARESRPAWIREWGYTREEPYSLKWHALNDPFLSHDSAELIQRLLSEGLRTPEPRIVDNPLLINRIKQLSDRVANLAESLVASSRRWLSKSARDNFKGLMDAAITQPQVVERGDDEIVVVSKRLLQRYADPKSATSIIESFLQRKTSIKPFELEEDTDSDKFDHFNLPRPQ
jgi:hypothetical protein